MSENLSIGKDIEVNPSELASKSSSSNDAKELRPTLTQYMIDGNKHITNKIYINPNNQNLISDFCLKGQIDNLPKSYEDELMDEFLSIGRTYNAVIYPSSEVLENAGDYNGNKDPQDSKDEQGHSDVNDTSDSQDSNNNRHQSHRNGYDQDYDQEGSEDTFQREVYDDYDFEYLNQTESYDSESYPNVYDNICDNFDNQEFGSKESVKLEQLDQTGVTIDHDLSQGISSKPFQKDEPYLGKGLDAEIPRHEQPREKALRLGIEALSDAELLALIFGTGIKGQNVLEMSRQILADNMNHLSHLARLSPQELTMRYKGIGQAKAIMLCAAMALGIRAERDAHKNQMRQIDSSLKAYHLLRPKLQWIEHEEFWVIFLSKSNNLKNCCCISRGGISETVVDVRIVIQRALQESASAMILVHNHPGSLLVPSQQDDQLTTKIVEAAKFFEIQVLDHIIIGASGYYSFKEHNHMGF